MGETVLLDTKCGKLKGLVQHSFEGYDYCAFRGIPYAKPPVGELRFKDPLPAEPWSGVRDATKYSPWCAQYEFTTRSVKGDDDCLYLNVYVKSIKQNSKLPVMVWIHGGAFTMGSGDDFNYGPDYLVKKDIVLVTINYRVGVLGFLNFDHEVAPGNQGLKDQVAALKWVKENITSFGGDSGNVTIFGESAGGASVHYLTLSPMARGLFDKAISQSGVACNSWAYSADKENAYRICEVLGNNSRDPEELVKFLRTVKIEKLVGALQEVTKNGAKFVDILSFGPGVDAKSKEPFLPIPVSEAIENAAHVPYMLGCNSREGILYMFGLKEKDYDVFNNDFEKVLSPRGREILQKNNITVSQLKSLYFGNEKQITPEDDDKIADFFGDMSFIEGIHRVVKIQVKRNSAPTYFYRFTYDKEISVMKTWSGSSISGTAHFDEVQFLFSMTLYDLFGLQRPKPGSVSHTVIERMVELWTNFAKYGRPTIEISDLIPTYWLPVTDEKMFRTLHINEDLRMENTVNIEEQYSFGKCMKNKL